MLSVDGTPLVGAAGAAGSGPLVPEMSPALSFEGSGRSSAYEGSAHGGHTMGF